MVFESNDIDHYQTLNQESYSKQLYLLKKLEESNSYLIYRDIPILLSKHVPQRISNDQINILDIGCSIGTSLLYFTNALQTYDYKLNAMGIDINADALAIARERFPTATFQQISDTDSWDDLGPFDLIICHFVLVEMHSDQMLNLLKKARKLLSSHGLMFVTNPTLDIYYPENDWYGVNNKFVDNIPIKTEGDIKSSLEYRENQTVILQAIDPNTNTEIITFHDFIHSEHAYDTAYQNAGFNLLERYFPMGLSTDKIPWLSELHKPRLRIDILSCK